MPIRYGAIRGDVERALTGLVPADVKAILEEIGGTVALSEVAVEKYPAIITAANAAKAGKDWRTAKSTDADVFNALAAGRTNVGKQPAPGVHVNRVGRVVDPESAASQWDSMAPDIYAKRATVK